MREMCGVTLNGVSLRDVDPRLIPLDFSCRPVFSDRPALIRAGAAGCRHPSPLLRENLATLTFEAHEADPAQRGLMIEKLLSFAMRGGYLAADARPGRRLYVSFRSLSEAGAREWTRPLELTMAAEGRPYWEDALPTAVSLAGDSAEGTLFAPGSAADAPVALRIRPEETMTCFTAAAGETRVSFSGLQVSAGREMLLTWDENGLFTAKETAAGTSLYGHLTADSDDGLFLPAHRRGRVGFAADAACRVTFEARGLYL